MSAGGISSKSYHALFSGVNVISLILDYIAIQINSFHIVITENKKEQAYFFSIIEFGCYIGPQCHTL